MKSNGYGKARKSSFQKAKTPTAPSVTFVKNTVKLTISLLVSNRIDTIRKCLESIKPLLEQLPSELIIVDTVGEENSDGSLAVAREYTDNIVRFHWCNDFAAARNAGLQHARGEWFLYLDDDEWFEDVTPIINFLQSDNGTYYFCIYYQRNYANDTGTAYKNDSVGRMFRRTFQAAFRDKIHEYPGEIITHPRTRLDCYVHHYGYIYTSEVERMAHSRRNLLPLLEMLEENPNNLRTIAHLSQEYLTIREYKKARELCERALQFGLKSPSLYIGGVISRYLNALDWLGEFQAMQDAAEALVSHPHVNELAKANICLILQNCPSLAADQALAYVDTYFSCLAILDKDPDNLSNQSIADLEECQNNQNRGFMLARALVLCKQLADWDKASAYIKKCVSGEQSEESLTAAMPQIVEVGLATENYPALCEQLHSSFQNESVLTRFLRATEELLAKERNSEKKWEGIRVLSELPFAQPRIAAQKILLAEQEGRNQELPALLEEYARLDIQDTPVPDILYLCYRNEVSPAPLVGKLFFETWQTSVRELEKLAPSSEQEAVSAFLERFYGPSSAEMLFLRADIQFRALTALLKRPAKEADAAFDAAFAQYIKTNYAFHRQISPPDNFTPERCIYLGKDARAAYDLKQALIGKQDGHMDLYLRHIRLALACREDLADVAKYVKQRMKAQQAEANSVSEQMHQLSQAVKGKIVFLLQVQEWAGAKSALDGLKALTPDDPELDTLYAKLPRGR